MLEYIVVVWAIGLIGIACMFAYAIVFLVAQWVTGLRDKIRKR